MAKQRLVDFRGGINKKISPHMIGDSQGQDAQDLDLSAVRLQGRKQIQGSTNDEKAQGTFFYEVGNISSPGFWVSTDSKDDSYIDGAKDFAVWNKDLYVARIASPGTLLIYLDGSQNPVTANFNAPTSPIITPSYDIASTQLVASVTTRVLATAQLSPQKYHPTSGTFATSGSDPTSGFTNAAPSSSTESDYTRHFQWEGTQTEFNNLGLNQFFSVGNTYPLYGRTAISSNGAPSSSYIEVYPVSSNSLMNGSFQENFVLLATVYSLGTNIGITVTLRRYDWNGQNLSNSINTALASSQRLYQSYMFVTGNSYTLSSGQTFNSTGDIGYFNLTLNSSSANPVTTPAFTKDDSRAYVYSQYTSSGSSWTSDLARGADGDGWLGAGASARSFTSDTTDGYYVYTVRNQGNLPVLSTGRVQFTLAANTNYIASGSRIPQRLNFSITEPTDSQSPLLGYLLYRVDSLTDTEGLQLGYINPDENDDGAGNTITLTGSGTSYSLNNLDTSATYRLVWWAYQDGTISFNGVTAKSSTTGEIFTSSTGSALITLNETTNDGFRAFDLWLEKRVLAGATSDADVYATVRCFDVFEQNSTTTINACDFLDVFSAGLSSGSISSSSTNTAAPDYLKFLKESNNFFFGVGTSLTNPNLFASNVNKKGSYLFVSEYNNPRNWPSTGYVEFDDEITGLASYPGELIVWTQNGTYRVTGSRPEQMRKIKLATTEGLKLNYENSIVLVDSYLVWVSQSGICFYNGNQVVNLTRGRFEPEELSILSAGSSIRAGQFEGRYYVIGSDETGYCVDFNLEGFPITEVDLAESGTTAFSTLDSSNNVQYPEPTLVYKKSENALYSRRGIIEGKTSRNTWSFKTRDFDGGSFGSLKLVKNVTINGAGSGTIQVYLDGRSVFNSPVSITVSGVDTSEPARIYLPASRTNNYGLSVADVWSVEIVSWSGKIDWIDTEYEIIAG